MINRRNRPLANDHPKGLASCNWSYRGSSLLQMIIWRIQPLANNHLEGQATCKWSSRRSGLLQMIIWRERPLSNDIRHPRHPNHLSQDLDWISRTFLEQFALVCIGPFKPGLLVCTGLAWLKVEPGVTRRVIVKSRIFFIFGLLSLNDISWAPR